MDRVVVEHYLAHAAVAASVRELHALARDVRRAHPGDPDADRVEQACWTAALRVVAGPRGVPRVDWKELAAPA